MMYKFSLSLIALFLILTQINASEFEKCVQNASITVKTNRGTGSGVLFIHKDISYVLTAGHVIAGSREVIKVDVEKNGEIKKVDKVSWKPINVTQVLFEKGKEVANMSYTCDVVAYSPDEESGGKDLAVLKLKTKLLNKSSAKFIDTQKYPLEIGMPIFHIGALFGSITGAKISGELARLDYTTLNETFNVANINGRPGSSGGGVFTKINNDFMYCGMIVRGDRGGIMLLKTPETIQNWLREQKLEYIINPSLKK